MRKEPEKCKDMSDPVVDYLDAVTRFDAEARKEREGEAVLPEAAGERVVDYLAVSKAWKEERGWMDHEDAER